MVGTAQRLVCSARRWLTTPSRRYRSTWGGRPLWSWWFAAERARPAYGCRLVEQTLGRFSVGAACRPGMDRIRAWPGTRGCLGGRVSVVDDNGPSLWLAGDMATPCGWRQASPIRHPRKRSCGCASRRRLHQLRESSAPLTRPAQSGTDEWRHPSMGRATTSCRRTAWPDCTASCGSRRIPSTPPCRTRRSSPAGGFFSLPGTSPSTSEKSRC